MKKTSANHPIDKARLFCLLLLTMCVAKGYSYSGEFHRIWLEHNVMHDGVKCLAIHNVFSVWCSSSGESGQITAFLDYSRGTGHKDTNGRYCNYEGNVCVSGTWTDRINGTRYNDYVLYLPNDEIHPVQGPHTYYIRSFLFFKGEILCHSDFVTFDMTGSYSQAAAPRNNNSKNEVPAHPVAPIRPDPDDTYWEGLIGTIYTRYWAHPDGGATIQQDWKCYACTLKPGYCNICQGSGNGYISIGRYLACVACNATGICGTCGGDAIIENPPVYWAPGQAEAWLQAHREVKDQVRHENNRGSRVSCPKCNGNRWEPTAYQYAASSSSGWMQPLHNTVGSKCSVCGYSSDHYHYPCSECQGHGQVKR